MAASFDFPFSVTLNTRCREFPCYIFIFVAVCLCLLLLVYFLYLHSSFYIMRKPWCGRRVCIVALASKILVLVKASCQIQLNCLWITLSFNRCGCVYLFILFVVLLINHAVVLLTMLLCNIGPRSLISSSETACSERLCSRKKVQLSTTVTSSYLCTYTSTSKFKLIKDK